MKFGKYGTTFEKMFTLGELHTTRCHSLVRTVWTEEYISRELPIIKNTLEVIK